jgi:3-phosphoshikimate 1-carboxyvinyltransferase
MKYLEAERLTLCRPSSRFLKGSIQLPGSKSETNRALVLGALDPFAFTVYNPAEAEDSRIVADFLNAVGIGVRVDPRTQAWVVEGHVSQSTTQEIAFDVRQAGTALRFLTALSCVLNGTTILYGTERLAARPLVPLVQALQSAGAQIDWVEQPASLPVRIVGRPGLRLHNTVLDASLSSQFLSALLLLAPQLPVRSTITVDTRRLASRSYADLTLRMLESLGIRWQETQSGWQLSANQLEVHHYEVESDWSAASYWLGLAATLPSELTLSTLRTDSLQGDRQQLEVFRRWGLFIQEHETSLDLLNEVGNLVQPVDLDCSLMPDLAQTFAVLACFADRSSRLTGLQTLAFKETDRLQALVTELGSLGVQAQATADTLAIVPAAFEHHHPIATYDDHRMAMSFSLLANLVDQVAILEPGVVRKSYPNFWDHLQQVGYSITLG